MLIRRIENQIFRRAAPLAIRHLPQPHLRAPDPLARKTLDQVAREFQLAPPITIHSLDPRLMAGVWSASRESYVVQARGRAVREAVAEAISRLNECPYCATVHSSLYDSTFDGKARLNDSSSLPRSHSIARKWAFATLSPDSDELRNPNIPSGDMPQIMGTAVVFHYLNRMVNVFLTEMPVPLPGMATGLAQRLTRASFTFFGNRFANLDPEPGRFVWEIDAELPAEFEWARPNPTVARGLAQFSHAALLAGEEALPEDVRQLVLDHLERWNGEEPGLSRSWIESEIADLEASMKPAARLAFLAARAAYQVDDGLIADFRKITPDDRTLIQTVAWSSFVAARRIAGWFD